MSLGGEIQPNYKEMISNLEKKNESLQQELTALMEENQQRTRDYNKLQNFVETKLILMGVTLATLHTELADGQGKVASNALELIKRRRKAIASGQMSPENFSEDLIF